MAFRYEYDFVVRMDARLRRQLMSDTEDFNAFMRQQNSEICEFFRALQQQSQDLDTHAYVLAKREEAVAKREEIVRLKEALFDTGFREMLWEQHYVAHAHCASNVGLSTRFRVSAPISQYNVDSEERGVMNIDGRIDKQFK